MEGTTSLDHLPNDPVLLKGIVRELLATLAGIQETVLLYHHGGKGRPRARRMLTETDPAQDRLADLFGIARYAPTR